MVQTLYKGSESAVLNNGFSTKYFPLNRSVKQGCCLSPYLFVLAIELLSLKLQTSRDLQGVSIKGSEQRVSLFADDLTVFAHDVASAKEAVRIINLYKRVSGLEINLKKSEIMWLNPKPEKQEKLKLGLKVVEKLKITGGLVWV